MKTRVTLIVLAAALACAGPIFAQLRGGTVEINPFAGYLFGGRFGRGTLLAPCTNPRCTSFDVHVGDDGNYGGRVGYNFNSLFELEFEYAQTDTNFQTDSEGSLPDARVGELKIQYFMGYTTFNFGHGRFVPYFTVGAGAAALDSSVSNLATTSDTRFTLGLGGGLKYFFSPHFAMRLDGRLYSTYLGSSDAICGYYTTCTQYNWMSNFVGNGGLIVAF